MPSVSPPVLPPAWMVHSPIGWVVRGWLKMQHGRGMPSDYKTLNQHRRAIEAYAQRVVDFHAWEQNQHHYRKAGNAVPLNRLSHAIEQLASTLPSYGSGTVSSKHESPRDKAWEQAWLKTLQTVLQALTLEIDPQEANQKKPAWWAMRLARISMHVTNGENHAWRKVPLSGFQQQILKVTEASIGFCEPPNEAVDGYHREWQGLQDGLGEIRAARRRDVLENAWAQPATRPPEEPRPTPDSPQPDSGMAIPSTACNSAPESPRKRPRF